MAYYKKETGDIGEDLALKFLSSKGMKLIERNFRCNFGEIDLIFRDKNALVFVEVKLRKSNFFGDAALAVNIRKQKKIVNIAKYYLQNKRLNPESIRFDVFGIEKDEGKWICKHYRNAFYSE
ncbi:MAG: hypothetical protein ACD_79C01084G0001 [uncultured bacterium]|nr:MAG: hypothetical protein ACD_79C01084G0001 [uncultured bacterium]